MNCERLTVVGVAVFAVAILATGGAAGADVVTLTVSVTDQDDDPVGGVDVVATWEESGETETATGTTASNGRVFLDVPENATVEIDVDDDTFIRNRPLTVEGASESDVELAVSRSGTAAVSVVDTRDRPQADARVRLRDGDGTVDRGQTDGSGVFTSSRVEQGTYTLRVVKPGFFETTQEVTIDGDANATVEIERGEVELTIRVFDDHFDPPEPIETSTVRLQSAVYDAQVTATEGRASLNVPVNVAYTAEVVKDGYDPTPEQISVREQDMTVNVTAQRTPSLTLTSANERVIVGERTRVTVTNAYDELVAGATIEVDGDAVGETDDRGELVVTIDAPGDRTIVATDGDVSSDPVTVEGVSEDTPDADTDADETDDGAPGFGLFAAVFAVIAAAVLVAVRRGGHRP